MSRFDPLRTLGRSSQIHSMPYSDEISKSWGCVATFILGLAIFAGLIASTYWVFRDF